MKAYKQISELFYAQYSIESLKQKFQHNPLGNDEDDEEKSNPFEVY